MNANLQASFRKLTLVIFFVAFTTSDSLASTLGFGGLVMIQGTAYAQSDDHSDSRDYLFVTPGYPNLASSGDISYDHSVFSDGVSTCCTSNGPEVSINKATSAASAFLNRNLQAITLSGTSSVSDPPWGSAVGVALASVAWEDTITIGSSGLYEYTVHWHGGLSASGLADLDVGTTFAGFVFGISGGGYSNAIARLISTDAGSPQTINLDKTVYFEATAGQVLHLTMNLDSEVSVAGNAFADAGHTASFNINPVTPGGNYITESGYTYYSEVPEPAPLISTSCALLILLGLKLRSQARRALFFGDCGGYSDRNQLEGKAQRGRQALRRFRMRSSLNLAIVALASAFLPVSAQMGITQDHTAPTQRAQPDRLKSWIGGGARVSLPGSMHPLARSEFDRGPVNPDLRLMLSMGLKKLPELEADLDNLLADLQNPQSAQYHQWLTPEEYADRFGVSQNDIDKIKGWLESEGFNVVEVARGRDYIRFSGTAAIAQKALGVDIHRYFVAGQDHFAITTPVYIPADLSGMVAAVRGLHDFLPKVRKVRRNSRTGAARTRRSQIADLRSARPHAVDGGGDAFLTPDDLATIYDLTPLYTKGWDGAGQLIAIAGASALDLTDIQIFREELGLPFNDPKTILVPGSEDPGVNDAMGEADLDIEWAGAIAPAAKIIYVYSGDPFISAMWAIDQAIAPVLSASFGVCEWHLTPDDIQFFRGFSKKGAALGVTWLASSGDSGAAGCENHGGMWTVATTRLSVLMPSSLPEVTAVGGTEFNEGGGSYWSFRSGPKFGMALSYIPEVVWNDERSVLEMSGSMPELSTVGPGFAAGGGGASIYFAKPSWQAGPGVPKDGARDVPDISFTASAAHDPYVIVSQGEASFTGGTSASTPVFAGVLALLNQYLVETQAQPHAGLGNINPMLYYLGQNAPGVYHDVTLGSNAVPCVPRSTQDCPSSGVYGFQAGPGYDLATGWGSVDVTKLIATWAAVLSTPTKKSVFANDSLQTGASDAGEIRSEVTEYRRAASTPETSGWPVVRR